MNSLWRKWLIFFSAGIMILLVNLDMTIVNLALAAIASFFNCTMNQAQWIIGGYLLATALSFIIFGRLADYWGRKNIFLFGVALFTFSSLLAGVTNNLSVLIFSRFVQGFGFAATLGLSLILIVNAFPENQKGYATGLAITITGLAQAIGPSLGGVILQGFNWHWIFLVNVPLGIISFIGTLFFVPRDENKFKKNIPLNFLNCFFFIFGLGLFLYALNQVSVLDKFYFFAALMVGSIFLFCFIKDCFNNPKALLDLYLLRHKNYLLIVLLRFIFMISMSSLLFLVPLYLQNVLDFSPMSAGLVLLAMTCFVAISSPLTGRILDRIGFASPVMLSFVLILVALGWMFFLQEQVSFFILVPSLIFFGLAVGVHTPSSINGVLVQIAKEKSGTAVGLFFTAAMIGAVSGIALCGVIFNYFCSNFLINGILKFGVPISTSIYHQLLRVAMGTVNIKEVGLTNAQVAHYQLITHQAFMHAFHIEIGVLVVLMSAGLLLSWHLKRASAR